MQRIGLPFLILFFVLLNVVAPVRAQDHDGVALHVFSSNVVLGYGEHSGTFQGGTILKQFNDLGFVGLTTGVISSSDLQFRPEDADAWRHRKLYLLEGISHFDIVTIPFSEMVSNRLSFKMGLSYQYGDEETTLDVTGPGLQSRFAGGVPDFLLSDGSLYVYEIDGERYNLHAVERSAAAIGSMMSIEYALQVGPLVVAAEGAYRHYRSGTPLMSYGLSVGLRY